MTTEVQANIQQNTDTKAQVKRDHETMVTDANVQNGTENVDQSNGKWSFRYKDFWLSKMEKIFPDFVADTQSVPSLPYPQLKTHRRNLALRTRQQQHQEMRQWM